MCGMDRGMLSDISAKSTVAIFIVTESGCSPELSYRSGSVWCAERDILIGLFGWKRTTVLTHTGEQPSLQKRGDE